MLMPLKDAAREIGVPYPSVRNYQKTGKLPTQKIGRIDAIEPLILKAMLHALGYRPRTTKHSQSIEDPR